MHGWSRTLLKSDASWGRLWAEKKVLYNLSIKTESCCIQWPIPPGPMERSPVKGLRDLEQTAPRACSCIAVVSPLSDCFWIKSLITLLFLYTFKFSELELRTGTIHPYSDHWVAFLHLRDTMFQPMMIQHWDTWCLWPSYTAMARKWWAKWGFHWEN